MLSIVLQLCAHRCTEPETRHFFGSGTKEITTELRPSKLIKVLVKLSPSKIVAHDIKFKKIERAILRPIF